MIWPRRIAWRTRTVTADHALRAKFSNRPGNQPTLLIIAGEAGSSPDSSSADHNRVHPRHVTRGSAVHAGCPLSARKTSNAASVSPSQGLAKKHPTLCATTSDHWRAGLLSAGSPDLVGYAKLVTRCANCEADTFSVTGLSSCERPADVAGRWTVIFKHSMDRSCRDWAPGVANAEFESLLESLTDQHRTAVILATDDSVTRDPPRTGWGAYLRSDRDTRPSSGACRLCSSSDHAGRAGGRDARFNRGIRPHTWDWPASRRHWLTVAAAKVWTPAGLPPNGGTWRESRQSGSTARDTPASTETKRPTVWRLARAVRPAGSYSQPPTSDTYWSRSKEKLINSPATEAQRWRGCAREDWSRVGFGVRVALERLEGWPVSWRVAPSRGRRWLTSARREMPRRHGRGVSGPVRRRSCCRGSKRK